MSWAFAQAEARWLEPPEVYHYSDCENLVWYYCTECQEPFSARDTNTKNMHDDCGTPFGKSYDDCVCYKWED